MENNTTQEKSSGDNSSPLLENKIQTVEAIDNSKDGSAATENPGNDESKSEVDTSLDVTNDSVSCMDKELIEKGKLRVGPKLPLNFTIYIRNHRSLISLFLIFV